VQRHPLEQLPADALLISGVSLSGIVTGISEAHIWLQTSVRHEQLLCPEGKAK